MQVVGTLLSGWLHLVGGTVLALLAAGCQAKDELKAEAHSSSPEGLVLLLSDVNDRVVISIANTGEQDRAIHRELLPSGPEPELMFEFNGAVAAWENAPHRGQLAMEENPNATVIVPAERVVGAMFFKEDLRRFYSLNKGECYKTRVFYHSTLEAPQAFRGEIVTNPTELCF